jgi:hypothetical protein
VLSGPLLSSELSRGVPRVSCKRALEFTRHSSFQIPKTFSPVSAIPSRACRTVRHDPSLDLVSSPGIPESGVSQPDLLFRDGEVHAFSSTVDMQGNAALPPEVLAKLSAR